MVYVIHRAQLVVLQQFGQLACIHAIILIALFQQSVSPRIADHEFPDVRFQQVVQPLGPGPFLEGDVYLSTQPINKLQDRVRFGFDDTFHRDLPASIPDCNGDAFLMHVHTDIFGDASHKRVCSFQGWFEVSTQTLLLKRGALLYCVLPEVGLSHARKKAPREGRRITRTKLTYTPAPLPFTRSANSASVGIDTASVTFRSGSVTP